MGMKRIQGVYMRDTARVMGRVTIAQDVSLWDGAVVRGDVAPIIIGKGTNLQEHTLVHCDHGVPNDIGEHVVIGHGAIVHGRRIGNHTLIGMGAVLLGRSEVGSHCLIAARALVTEGMIVPDNSVVMGIPGKIVRQTTEEEREMIRKLAEEYVHLARHHHEHPDDELVRPWSDGLLNEG
ncbi:MAG: hypothetical protein Kow00105_18870 [Phycisphaeraceae bacterium]